MTTIMNHNKAIAILGLSNNFTEEDIKSAKRKLLSKYHPDRYPEDQKEFATEKAKDITQAAVYLLDELKNNKTSSHTSYSRNKKSEEYAFLREKETIVTLKSEMYKSIMEYGLLVNWVKDFASIDDIVVLARMVAIILAKVDGFDVDSYSSIQKLQNDFSLLKMDVTIRLRMFKVKVCNYYRKRYPFADEDYKAALKKIMNDDISAEELKEVLITYTFYNTLYQKAKVYLDAFKGNDTVISEIINEIRATLGEYIRSNYSNERELTETFRLRLEEIIAAYYRSLNIPNNNKYIKKEEEKGPDFYHESIKNYEKGSDFYHEFIENYEKGSDSNHKKYNRKK